LAQKKTLSVGVGENNLLQNNFAAEKYLVQNLSTKILASWSWLRLWPPCSKNFGPLILLITFLAPFGFLAKFFDLKYLLSLFYSNIDKRSLSLLSITEKKNNKVVNENRKEVFS
jgi:hypothetical protein